MAKRTESEIRDDIRWTKAEIRSLQRERRLLNTPIDDQGTYPSARERLTPQYDAQIAAEKALLAGHRAELAAL